MSRPTFEDACNAWDERLLAVAGEQRDEVDRIGGQYGALDGSQGNPVGHAFAGFDLDLAELNVAALNVARNAMRGLTGPAGIGGSLAGSYITGVGTGLMLAELRSKAGR